MKKLATFVFALLVAASLSFAQDTGGGAGKGKTDDTSKTDKGDKKGKKKGGKKGKKGDKGGDTTAPPK